MLEASPISQTPLDTTRLASVNPEAIAAQTENPRLWLIKYSFYIDQLGFSETEAIRWANRSVRIDSDISKKLKLLEVAA